MIEDSRSSFRLYIRLRPECDDGRMDRCEAATGQAGVEIIPHFWSRSWTQSSRVTTMRPASTVRRWRLKVKKVLPWEEITSVSHLDWALVYGRWGGVRPWMDAPQLGWDWGRRPAGPHRGSRMSVGLKCEIHHHGNIIYSHARSTTSRVRKRFSVDETTLCVRLHRNCWADEWCVWFVSQSCPEGLNHEDKCALCLLPHPWPFTSQL